MERTYSGHKVKDLFEIVENSLLQITREQGHVDDGYCLLCDDEPFKALEELEFRMGERPDCPKQLHQQYMAVLDERDKLQEEIDLLRVDAINEYRCPCGSEHRSIKE